MQEMIWIAVRDGLLVYDSKLEQKYCQISTDSRILDACVTNDGMTLAWATTASLQFSRLQSRAEITIEKPLLGVRAIRICDEMSLCIAFGETKRKGFIFATNLSNYNECDSYTSLDAPVVDLAIQSKGRLVAICEDASVHCYTLDPFENVYRTSLLPHRPRMVLGLRSRDEVVFISKEDEVIVFNSNTHELRTVHRVASCVTRMVLNDSQNLLAIGSSNGTISVFETLDWNIIASVGSNLTDERSGPGIVFFSGVSSMSFSIQNTLAAALSNGEIRFWDKSFKPIRNSFNIRTGQVSYSRDGNQLLCSNYQSVVILDTEKFTPEVRLELGADVLKCGWLNMG